MQANDLFRQNRLSFHIFPFQTDDILVSADKNIFVSEVELVMGRHPDVV